MDMKVRTGMPRPKSGDIVTPEKALDTRTGMDVMSTRAAKIRTKADPLGAKLTRTRARRSAKGRGVKVRGLVARLNSALRPRDKRGRFVRV
jgi:hypothetical protein